MNEENTYWCPMCGEKRQYCPHLKDLYEDMIWDDEDGPVNTYKTKGSHLGAFHKEVLVRRAFEMEPGSVDAQMGGCSCDPEKNSGCTDSFWVNTHCPLHKHAIKGND